MSSNPRGSEPTAKEAHFMMQVLRYQEGKPKVDWNAVAEATGLKNGSTANARFGQIKKRHGWTTGPATSSSSPTKPTKARPSPRSRRTPKKASDKDSETKDKAGDTDANVEVEDETMADAQENLMSDSMSGTDE
ncbi:MAG: hypothetical protein M1815_005219 [Lichina confinis]|nr:MAG: hypothetical protein M1815_005219 [Lichina confinis]